MLSLWTVLAAVGGILVGVILGFAGFARLFRAESIELDKRIKTTQAADLTAYLNVLRRELGNWMIRHDADRYIRVYEATKDEIAEINKASGSVQNARLLLLAEKYPSYVDFDIVGARDYVLYEDTLNGFEDVETAYKDIASFQSLKFCTDEHWRWQKPPTDEKELEHLRRYARRLEDSRFKNRLRDAVASFRAFQWGQENVDNAVYEDRNFSVRPVSHFAETRYGVHFKATDEYGLYSVFYYDEVDRPPHEGYCRSDATFEKQTYLDDLRIDAPL